MDNERTYLENSEVAENNHASSNAESKKSSNGKTAAAAFGGFVAGATAGIAGTAYASQKGRSENEDSEEANADSSKSDNLTSTINNAPRPEQVILANDEGIRIAHVNADNFAEAFSQARAQVGAGGIFEYDGKLYGTYLADEWNQMSDEEKIDFQSRVNNMPASYASTTVHHTEIHNHYYAGSISNNHDEAANQPATGTTLQVEEVNDEVRVLGVETVQTEDGQIMNIAALEHGDDHALLVDVNNDGMMEVLLHDDNNDGQLQENEIYDISEAQIAISDLVDTNHHTDQYMASADDGMPDYVNDPDNMMSI